MSDDRRMELAELGCMVMTGTPLSVILDKFAVSDRARQNFIEGFALVGEVIEDAEAAGRIPSSKPRSTKDEDVRS